MIQPPTTLGCQQVYWARSRRVNTPPDVRSQGAPDTLLKSHCHDRSKPDKTRDYAGRESFSL
jgi:hypothetical protein